MGAELDQALERFDRFSAALVHVEPWPLEDVRREVAGFLRLVEQHLVTGSSGPTRGPSGTGARPGARRLELEHQRFHSSVEQLRELLSVVEGEDHGGHRQALGQYGRIFAEAFRRHRADELGPDDALPRTAPEAVGVGPGKR